MKVFLIHGCYQLSAWKPSEKKHTISSYVCLHIITKLRFSNRISRARALARVWRLIMQEPVSPIYINITCNYVICIFNRDLLKSIKCSFQLKVNHQKANLSLGEIIWNHNTTLDTHVSVIFFNTLIALSEITQKLKGQNKLK